MIRPALRRLVRPALVGIGMAAVAFDAIRSMGTRERRSEARDSRTARRPFYRRLAPIVGALLFVGGSIGALVVVSGVVPIKASSGHWPMTAWFLDFAKQRSIATHTLFVEPPHLDDPALVMKGAGHYDIGCRPCHGSPALRQPRIAQYMTPRPPYLASSVRELDPAELFYIVKHGIKLTGMPAWPAQHRDDEVWAMVAFLRTYPDIDVETYQRLVGTPPAGNPGAPIEGMGPPPVSQVIVESCARCHGLDGLGRGRGAFPRLAGQRPDYLHASMQAYAAGKRHSGIMEPIAAGLDAGKVRSIIEYYANLPSPWSPAASENPPDRVERGRAIASRGIPDRLVPPCSECHGPDQVERNEHYPVLAGQYADYLFLQLTLFKEGRRGGTAYQHIMQRVARQLTAEQMRDAAAYFSSLPVPVTGAALR